MFKKARKLSTFIFMLILIASMVVQPLCAATIDTEEMITASVIEPRWKHTQAVVLNLNFDDPEAIYCSVDVTAYSGTTFKNGTVTLADVTDGTIDQIEQWSGLSSSTPYFNFTDESIAPVEGRTYRLIITIHAVRNGTQEAIVQYIDRTYTG